MCLLERCFYGLTVLGNSLGLGVLSFLRSSGILSDSCILSSRSCRSFSLRILLLHTFCATSLVRVDCLLEIFRVQRSAVGSLCSLLGFCHALISSFKSFIVAAVNVQSRLITRSCKSHKS